MLLYELLLVIAIGHLLVACCACVGFRLELVQGRKHRKNPLVVPDTAAEGEAVVLGGTVRYDEGSQQFRMWYQGVDKVTYHLLYAESTDGVDWSKPNLNTFQILPRGEKDNNIFMLCSGVIVPEI